MSDRRVDEKRIEPVPPHPKGPPTEPDAELAYVLEKGREPRVGKLFP